VKQLEVFPCIIVNAIWRACNNNILKKEDIPLVVTDNLVIRISKEVLVDPKVKNPSFLIMLELEFDVHWGFFNKAIHVHPLVCGVGTIFFIK
jgi:hypothetical protein